VDGTNVEKLLAQSVNGIHGSSLRARLSFMHKPPMMEAHHRLEPNAVVDAAVIPSGRFVGSVETDKDEHQLVKPFMQNQKCTIWTFDFVHF
jgi:hypothetical protein